VLAIAVRQTIGIPAQDPAEGLQPAHRIGARSERHAAGRHMEDICAACLIEHVRPLKKARKRLAVGAVADKPQAGVRRNLVCNASHVAAQATTPEMIFWALSHDIWLCHLNA
jgi:hypothetical protein